MKIISTVTIFFFIFISFASSQNNDEPVAVLGNQSISADEFQFRYELTPQLFREHRTAGNQLKQEFLYTLIAEKLLASYGESILLDTVEMVRHTLNSFEEMFVRDELYKQMIVEKARTKADSLLGFYIANSTTVNCTYIRSNKLEEIEKIYSLLIKDTPFEFFNSDSSLSLGDTLTITFGQYTEGVENQVLTLSENTFSKPLLIEDQWYIIKVVKKNFPIIERTAGWESEYERLNKLAKERAEYSFYKDYLLSVFGKLNVKANGKLLKLFAEEINEHFAKKIIQDGEQKKYYLGVSDLTLVQRKLSDENLRSTFVNLPGGAAPLKDFVNSLRFENVSFDSISYSIILDALNSRTRKFIEFKILANEGYKLGLQNTKDVRDKFNMWKQNYYYQLVTMSFADSANVTDDEIKIYYNQLNRGKLKTKEVNIVEVLVKDIDSAEKVLTELENGTDIKTIASKYSIKNGASNSTGESGYKPIIYFNEIGSILDRMKAGEVYGPTKVSEGYSIFKLVDIREDSTQGEESFNQIKTELENELRHLKIKNSMNQFIAKLAKEKNVSINQELLNGISITTHNSVVFQLLGFGGRITAVPLITPNSEWVKDWMDSLKVIP